MDKSKPNETDEVLLLLCDRLPSGHLQPKEWIQLITREFRKANPRLILEFNFHRNQFWIYFFPHLNQSQQETTMKSIQTLILNHLSTENNSVSIEQLNKVLHAFQNSSASDNETSEIVLH